MAILFSPSSTKVCCKIGIGCIFLQSPSVIFKHILASSGIFWHLLAYSGFLCQLSFLIFQYLSTSVIFSHLLFSVIFCHIMSCNFCDILSCNFCQYMYSVICCHLLSFCYILSSSVVSWHTKRT